MSTSAVSGGVRSVVQVADAGVASVLPAASVAATVNVCAPSVVIGSSSGDAQGVTATPSSVHANVTASGTASSVAANVRRTVARLLGDAGPWIQQGLRRGRVRRHAVEPIRIGAVGIGKRVATTTTRRHAEREGHYRNHRCAHEVPPGRSLCDSAPERSSGKVGRNWQVPLVTATCLGYPPTQLARSGGRTPEIRSIFSQLARPGHRWSSRARRASGRPTADRRTDHRSTSSARPHQRRRTRRTAGRSRAGWAPAG